MSAHPSKPTHHYNSVLAALTATFAVFRDGLPLAIGIHKAIRERLPDIGGTQLRMALKRHTASTKYLKAVANGQKRFDLDGNPTGDITADQREQALATLKERFRKAAEQKRTEQAAKERQVQMKKTR